MSLPDTNHTEVGPPSLFVTTRWSVVRAAQEKSSPESAAALETLCRAYWYPLYAYVRIMLNRYRNDSGLATGAHDFKVKGRNSKGEGAESAVSTVAVG